jgi:signal transduction histidine kinase/streptogramin lyase
VLTKRLQYGVGYCRCSYGYVAVILFQFFILKSNAQPESVTPRKGFSQYKITYWTTDDGLPGNTLVSLYQDKKGYLWIGSYQGLIRFDGNKFNDYNDVNTPDLVSHHIRVIMDDDKGNMWLGTGQGLVQFTDNKFINRADSLTQFFIESMSFDKINQRIWIGTRSAGVYCYYIRENRYEKIESLLSKDLIYAIACTSNGGVWVGGGKSGLGYYENGTWTYYNTSNGMPSSEILSMFINNGTIYIGTPAGLVIKENDKFSVLEKFSDMSINAIKKDSDGNLWVLTSRGVYKQSNYKDWERISTKEGISDNDVRDMLIDNEGTVWLATYRGGLNQLKETKFFTLAEYEGIDADVIREIEQWDENTFMAISTDGKLYEIENGKAKLKPLKNQLTRTYDLLIDKDKNLWIASYSGLLLKRPDGSETMYTEKDGLPSRQLRIIIQDSKGRYWIGTQNQGLLLMDWSKNKKPVFKKYKNNELNSMFIMSIREDKNGNMLISTNTGGLNIITPDEQVKIYSRDNGLISNLTFSTHTDNENVIWVASTEGIARIENGKCYNFTRESELPQESIFDIVEDDLGYLWMSAAIGIIRVEKAQMNDFKEGKIKSIYWKVYGKHDELKKSECTGTAKVLKAKDGTLWFPMNGGIVAVDPASLVKNERVPDVYIEKVIVDEKEVESGAAFTVPPSVRRVVFHYTGISLKYPRTTQYKYQLVNFDRYWVDAGSERQIVYTSLPKGNYVFRVIACNNDGVWNTTGASIAFTVQPYFYETLWFYAVVIVVIGLGMFGYTRWRTRTIMYRNLELENEVAKRTHQLIQKSESLEEEMSEKNSILNIVSHDLRSPLNKIKGLSDLIKLSGGLSNEQNEYVNHIVQSVDEGDALIRDLLEAESVENARQKAELTTIEVEKFLQSWQLGVNAHLSRKKQHLQLQNNTDEKLIITSDPLIITRILDNLVSNASKFSDKGKTIWVSVNKTNADISFSIRDEGPGISEADQKLLFKKFQKLTARPTAGEGSTGLGLSITKALVENLGGTIEVQSKIGEGAEFVVKLPLMPL